MSTPGRPVRRHPGRAPAAPRPGVRVDLGARSYDVLTGSGLLANLGALVRERLGAAPRAALLAFDTNLPAPVVASTARALTAAGFAVARAGVLASEKTKTLDAVAALLHVMAAKRHERADPVVALGGGVVGDVAGFAAAIYRRGVPLVQAPTTLLAMVDASVGGKTGVNLPVSRVTRGRGAAADAGAAADLLKNMAGAFHQPRLVVADVETLASLPERHFRAGLAECVKHGLIGGEGGDETLLDYLESRLDLVLERERVALTELVRRNVFVKAGVVARDEREEASDGGRMALNLGHTFAHAIETLPGLEWEREDEESSERTQTRGGDDPGLLLHGEAVGVGLVAACAAGERLGITPAGLSPRVRAMLRRVGLPVTLRGLPGGATLARRMLDDKKVSAGRLRIIVPAPGARARVVSGPAPEVVRAAWATVTQRR